MFAGLRRTAAVVLVGTVLVGAAGCSGEDKEPGGKADAKPSASTPAPGGGPAPLTEAQLKAAAFTDGEKVGAYTASEYALGVPHSESYTATPAVCQPLVSLAKEVADPDPAAEVQRQIDVPDEMIGINVGVQLRSYAGDGAATVLKNLAAAGTQCAAGFTEERAVARAKYLKVEPAKAPAIGDEAKAYRFTILDVKGVEKLYEYLTVVRSGSSTLAFRAEITDTKDVGGVPAEIITAQWKKFQDATGNGA